ncbi:MAG: GTPase ObgE [Planctomycetota bacterium]|nr:GTPase ObgE [Planctomycetota bacterium]
MFIDEVTIHVKAGRGGDGCVAFLREKFRPWGGPAGGDGGKGGDVVFEVSTDVDTLLHLYRRKVLKAKNGAPGANKNCSGRMGQSTLVKVPAGTIVKDADTGEVLADLTTLGQTFIAAAGGKGGRGNQHFASSTHQTPREFEFGEEGVERDLHLELKLIADVGLIGLPNAGKSTLISRISAARPKIAPYPFTTKAPNLGIVSTGDFREIVVADLPGLIEGAHAGAGLGHEFLRHVERTSFLVHVVDAVPPDGADPAQNFRLIERELALFSEVLAARPRMVVANKADLTGAAENIERMRKELGCEVVAISAATGEGLKRFLEELFQRISEIRAPARGAWS